MDGENVEGNARMKVYYYTQDEATSRFITAEYDSVSRKVCDLTGSISQELANELSDKECAKDWCEDGLAISVVSRFISAYVSFVFLLDDGSTNGRPKVVYGCTETIVLTNDFKGFGAQIAFGFAEFCKTNGVRFLESRLKKFEEMYERALISRCAV